jgi:hypothetical protein
MSRKLLISMILVTATVFMGACNMPSKAVAPPQQGAGMIHTVAAQTVAAQMTQVALGGQNAQQEQQPGQQGQQPGQQEQQPAQNQPSDTPVPPPTNTPLPPPTNTPVPPPTNTPIPCDHLDFGDPVDVTIPDGTDIDPGATFKKIWRLKNGGSCTWTSGYQLVFVSGDNMGAPASVQLTSGSIVPGQELDFALDLVAPNNPGTYRSYFKLRNPGGVLFGWGSNNDKSFWVEIEVVQQTGLLYDFITGAENADWGTGTTPVDFPNLGDTNISYGGPDTDANGFVMVKDLQTLEGGVMSGKILETHPKWVNDGYIIGRFPLYDVGNGDYIRTKIGFIAGGGCGAGDAIFKIYYTIGNDMGTLAELASWHETCDGSMHKVTADLDALKGKSIRIYLVVLANGSSGQDWAVWDSLGIFR